MSRIRKVMAANGSDLKQVNEIMRALMTKICIKTEKDSTKAPEHYTAFQQRHNSPAQYNSTLFGQPMGTQKDSNEATKNENRVPTASFSFVQNYQPVPSSNLFGPTWERPKIDGTANGQEQRLV
ncbi:MAG: hypothetical protein Q9198_004044 [Flavoplaca austrocitrina]